jgi:hypothetical protein
MLEKIMKESPRIMTTERNSTKITRNNSMETILNLHLPTVFTRPKREGTLAS